MVSLSMGALALGQVPGVRAADPAPEPQRADGLCGGEGRMHITELLKNVRYEGASPLDAPTVKQAIADAEATLAGRGRLVIRASGTEPLIRVMAEGDDADQVETVVDRICDAVRGAA
mgnify:CR=1 FL=1